MKKTVISLPSGVENAISRLTGAGYGAYLVGGSVRDSLMGRPVHDYDLTTSALPEQVLELFSDTKVFTAGIKHGTVTVLAKGDDADGENLSGNENGSESENRSGSEWVEITTYRTDGKYSDGRHPDGVTFSTTLDDDLSRRDFTINAMAYSASAGLVDRFGGVDDIKRRTVRCVGEPRERFTEDALRILRAFRFAAKLDFSVEPETLRAAFELKNRLRLISAERIAEEFRGILASPRCSGILELMISGGVADVILPGIRLTCADAETADRLPAVPELRFGALLRGRGRDEVCGALRALKLSNDTVKKVSAVALMTLPESADPIAVRKFAGAAGPHGENILLAAGARGERAVDGSSPQEILTVLRRIIDEKDPLTISDLAVNGKDLAAAGIPFGKDTGRILKLLLDEVIADPGMNTRERLLARSLELL